MDKKRETVADYLAGGGQLTICPTRPARAVPLSRLTKLAEEAAARGERGIDIRREAMPTTPIGGPPRMTVAEMEAELARVLARIAELEAEQGEEA